MMISLVTFLEPFEKIYYVCVGVYVCLCVCALSVCLCPTTIKDFMSLKLCQSHTLGIIITILSCEHKLVFIILLLHLQRLNPDSTFKLNAFLFNITHPHLRGNIGLINK